MNTMNESPNESPDAGKVDEIEEREPTAQAPASPAHVALDAVEDACAQCVDAVDAARGFPNLGPALLAVQSLVLAVELLAGVVREVTP